ncbi:MAG TPA: PAS domain-containing protein [Nitrospiraceae bacterium]|nr:PAS domain-containing protein [Nitrospiraceae bacterium]
MNEIGPEQRPVWNETLLRAVTDASPLACYAVHDHSEAVLYANHRFFELLGIQALERSWRDWHLDNQQVIDQLLPLLKDKAAFLRGLTPPHTDQTTVVEDELLLVDGRIIRRFCAALKGSSAIHSGRLYSFGDITPRKRAEAAPQRSGERYESLIQSIVGMVWEADPDTFQTIFMSRQCEHILSYPADQWTSTPGFWKSRIHPEDRERTVASYRRMSHDKIAAEFEYRMIDAESGLCGCGIS